MYSSASITSFLIFVACAMMMTVSSPVTQKMPLPQPTGDKMLLPEEDLNMAAVVPPENDLEDLSDIPKAVSANSAVPEVYSLHVRSDVKYRYATTLVTSRVVNRGHKAEEVTFKFVLPENAFISGFLLEVKGKVYKAYVKEKEEAKRVYQDAVDRGHTAAHVALSARDSNLFAVSVNLEPQSKMIFNLTYEELLSRRLGLYNQVIHLITSDKVIRDMKVVVAIDEPQNITTIKVPEPTLGNEVIDPVTGGLVEITRPSQTSAMIEFVPTMEQQLMLLTNRSEESGSQRLRVQYDVDHSASGEILLRDGYFVHFFAPKEDDSQRKLNKHVIFVLDTSSSMSGRKIEQLREAMLFILDSLSIEKDYFSLVEFSTSVKVWSPRNEKIHLASSTKIEEAKRYIESMEVNGATNIAEALHLSLQISALGASGNPFRGTDEEQKNGRSIPQPLVIFLTDGEPTEGETSLAKILDRTRVLNAETKVPVFSLAFGTGADFRFLKKLSLQNHGFARRIYEAADASLQLESFFQEVSSPLMNNVTFTYVNPKVDLKSLTESTIHTYFGGTEVIIAGRVNDVTLSADELGGIVYYSSTAITPGSNKQENLGKQTELEGNSADSPSMHGVIIPKLPPPLTPEQEIHESEKGSLERLWAFLTIRQLLDKSLAMEEEKDSWYPTTQVTPIDSTTDYNSLTGKELTPKQKALQLALKYGFVTPLTSLVVVKPPEKSKDGAYEDHGAIFKKSYDNLMDDLPGVYYSGQSTLGLSKGNLFFINFLFLIICWLSF